ncbi:MAG: DUF3999 domain-containing protein [Burkholderiales bacterium]
MKFVRHLWLLWPLAFVHAAQAPGEFAYFMPIEMAQGSGLVRITLPAAVYEGSVGVALADIRVFDNKGRGVPYAREPVQQEKTQGALVPLTYFPMYSQGPVSMEGAKVSVTSRGKDVTVQLQDGSGAPAPRERILRGYLADLKTLEAPLAAMEFDWDASGENGVVAVRIEASEDLGHWSVAAGKATLAKLNTAGHSLLRNTVELRHGKRRYLRITFPDALSTPHVSAIRGRLGDTTVAPERSWKEIPGKSPATAEADFDLGGQMPVDRLQLSIASANAVLPAEVLSKRKQSDPWMPVARYTFYRIQQRAPTVTNPELSIPVSRHRYWKIRLIAPGVIPEPLALRAGWLAEKLVFVAQGEAPFRLVYGSARAQDTSLQIQSLVPGFGTDRAPQIGSASLHGQQVLAGPAAHVAPLDYKKASLWAALVMGAGVLAWMAWSLTRDMKR